jgi:cytochrome c-type biogenesis protein CcmH
VSSRRTSADTTLAALTRSVAAQLRCPVCQGLSLADSPSELALEMKDVVRDQLAAGRTPDEVKAYFVAKYGEWILLEPPRRGVNLLAYALPAIALVAGLGVIWLALRRWTSGAPPAEELPVSDPVD